MRDACNDVENDSVHEHATDRVDHVKLCLMDMTSIIAKQAQRAMQHFYQQASLDVSIYNTTIDMWPLPNKALQAMTRQSLGCMCKLGW